MTVKGMLTLMLLGCFSAGNAQVRNEVIKQKIESYIFKPKELPPSDANLKKLKMPEGFVVTRFAEDLGKPRMLRTTDNGTVYVTDRDSGIVTMLRDTDKDGKADVKKVVFRKEKVHGIEIRNDDIYLITVEQVFKGKIQKDGSFHSIKTIVDGLPDGGQHANRSIKIGPDNMLYITVGSTCNACEETRKESATIIQTDLAGGNRSIFATGLRNTIGFDWHPQTKELYGFDHGIDWLGDDEQREEFNKIVKGGNYGWPYVYEDGKANKADEPKGLT